jgi:hypothetical protein
MTAERLIQEEKNTRGDENLLAGDTRDGEGALYEIVTPMRGKTSILYMDAWFGVD